MQQIRNIIFDLGGVLLDVDYNRASSAFIQLGVKNFDELYSQYKSNDLFEKLETGEVSEKAFYQAIREYSKIDITEEAIETAWNSMLLDFRKPSLSFLDLIKDKYRVFLFSNTNSIHHKAFREIFTTQTGKASLDDYFIKSYYSHVVGMRKPYKESYQFILQDAGINAGETLFIDDSYNNIEGAKETGILTHLLLEGEKIEELGL